LNETRQAEVVVSNVFYIYERYHLLQFNPFTVMTQFCVSGLVWIV